MWSRHFGVESVSGRSREAVPGSKDDAMHENQCCSGIKTFLWAKYFFISPISEGVLIRRSNCDPHVVRKFSFRKEFDENAGFGKMFLKRLAIFVQNFYKNKVCVRPIALHPSTA